MITKSASGTTENEAKELNDEFFSMLIGTLSASLLGNLLYGKGAGVTSRKQGLMINGPRISVGQDLQCASFFK